MVDSASGNFASYDKNGQLYNSGIKANDTLGPSGTVLWSSSMIAEKANLAPPEKSESLAIIDEKGQYKDSGLFVNDTREPSSFVVWTSSRMNMKADKADVVEKGNLTSLDASGQYRDSGLRVDDTSPPSTFKLWTSAKTASKSVVIKKNDLASIDEHGQYQDSGYSVDDKTLSRSSLWSSLKIGKLSNIVCVYNNEKQSVKKDETLNFPKMLFQNGDNILSDKVLAGGNLYKLSGGITFTDEKSKDDKSEDDDNTSFVVIINDEVSTTCNVVQNSSTQLIGFLNIDRDSILEVKMISGKSAEVTYSWLQIECIG